MCGNDKSFPCFKVGRNDAGTTRSFPPIFEDCMDEIAIAIFAIFRAPIYLIFAE